MGMPVPKAIDEVPELPMGTELYWEAFIDLMTSRPAPDQPLAWTAMNDWCKCYGVLGESAEDLIYVVRLLDAELLRFRRERSADKPQHG